MAGCNGPDQTRWSTELQACVGGGQTSCDESTQTTCYYAYLNFAQDEAVLDATPRAKTKVLATDWFGGKFVEGGFRIDKPGGLSLCGVVSGDIISQINGHVITPENIESYTPAKPVRFAEKICSTTGQVKLRLSR